MATKGLNYDDFGVLSDMNNDTLTMAHADPSVVTPNLSTIERTPKQLAIQQDAVKTAAPVPTDKYYGGAGSGRKAFDELKGNTYAPSGQSTKGQVLADKAAEIRKNPGTLMGVGQVRTPEQMKEPAYLYERDHPGEFAIGNQMLDRQARDAQDSLSGALAGATSRLDSLDVMHKMGYSDYEGKNLLADRDERIKYDARVKTFANMKGDFVSGVEGAAIDEHNKEVVKNLKTKQLAAKKTNDSLKAVDSIGNVAVPAKTKPRGR